MKVTYCIESLSDIIAMQENVREEGDKLPYVPNFDINLATQRLQFQADVTTTLSLPQFLELLLKEVGIKATVNSQR